MLAMLKSLQFNWLKIGLYAFVVVAIIWSANAFIDGQRKIGYDEAIRERENDLKLAKESAETLREQLQAEKDSAELNRTNHEKELSILRDRANRISVKLRDTEHALNEYIDGSTVETCRTTAKTAIQLFGACVERYRDVAEAAAGHLADVELFEQSYPTGRIIVFTDP